MRHFIKNARWVAALVALVTLPVVSQVKDTLEFDISDRTFEIITVAGETFNRYSYPECDQVEQVGAPMLPVKYIRLSVPYNATNINVTGVGAWSTGSMSRRIYPAPKPLTTNEPVPDQPDLVIDSTIYMTNAYWPASPAQLVGDGFYMGENRIVTVAVYPMLYNPVASRIRNYSRVRVFVSYDLGGTPANMLVRRGGDLRQQEQLSVTAMVENPYQVEGFAMTVTQAQHMPAHGLLPDSVLTDTASYHYGGKLYGWDDRARYLIVTTRELAPSFKRLAALKRQKGYSVQIKCIEDILTDSRVQAGDVFVENGDTISVINDDAGKLRQYLKLAHAYDNTQFVLLGGKNVPFRCHIRAYLKNGVMHTDSLPTDWYYSDLTTRWDVDTINGIITKLSLYSFDTPLHDLLVGRLMADTGYQIENYTDKLLRYELNPGHGDASYLNRCLVVEGSELNPNLSTGTIMANAYSQLTPNTTLIKQQGHNYPTGGEVISLISENKYGVLSIHGHGNPYTTAVNDWNTGYSNQDSTIATGHRTYQRIASLDEYYSDDLNNGLDCLTNKYYPGIYYSWSCENAPFDNFQRSYYKPYGCNMAQSYVLGKDYGGVAFLGNTRTGYYSSSKIEEDMTNSPKLEKMFVQILSGGTYRLSEAEAESKENYFYLPSNVYSYGQHLLLTHNLHGDPELKIWPGMPQCYENISVSRNNNSITVAGFSQQDSVVVAILSNQRTIHQLVTANGCVTFNNVDPNSTTMVYNDYFLPFIAPLFLQNERITKSQYVIANDVYAGRNVDSNRTKGDLIIAAGVEYELDARGQVVLAPGFAVEQGALFSVTKSDY